MDYLLYTTEEWKEIPFAPGYHVSSLGRVKGRKGGVIKPFINRDGYEVYTFHLGSRPGERFKRSAHTLVCTIFNGDKPADKQHCAHIDGDKLNNRATNLRWATAKENAADSMRLGRYKTGDDHWSRAQPWKVARGDSHFRRIRPETVIRGENVYNATLTNAQAAEIRNEPKRNGIVEELSKKYGVSTYVIQDIRRGKTYKGAP